MRIRILNFGGIGREYREVTGFYERRISALCRFRVDAVKRIPEGAILLDPRGREMGSDEFFELIRKKSSGGEEIIFAVGPPEGFSDGERKGHALISLSRLTMRHELAYLVLLEQIYRALLRMKGTGYER